MENLLEESVIGQRQVYDAILSVGGIKKVNVMKQMILAPRNSHTLYVEKLNQKQKQCEINDSTTRREKRAALIMKELEEKKRKVMEEVYQSVARVEGEMLSPKSYLLNIIIFICILFTCVLLITLFFFVSILV